jgi:hypothetical protein
MQNRRALALLIGSLSLSSAACSSDPKNGSAVGNAAGSTSPGAAGSMSTGATSSGSGGSSVTNIDVHPDPDGGTITAPPPTTDVTVIITADNAYGFGYGTDAQLVNYFGGVENVTSAEIFSCPIGVGPEQYTVPAAQANVGGFLYIIAYADRNTTQGVLAKFFREGADPVYTGSGQWQACATGVDFDPGSGGPSLDIINQQIAACNAANTDPATTSVGWVGSTPSARGNVATGEDNSTPRTQPMPGNEFNIACGIEPAAHWMWYDWESARVDGSPFLWPGGDGNPIKDFLIFRLAAAAVPEKSPT